MSKTIKRLSPPALPDLVLDRPEVNRAIDAAMKKAAVFIQAPAGFGKTLALSMWLLKEKAPAAWIPLTIYDDSPSVFCRYLLMALSSLDDSAAGPAKSALDDPGLDAAPLEYFFKVISSISDDCTGGIIVLDDFHLIENESILKTLPLMIKKLSPTYKIAALSRLNPPESFSELALKNRIGEINQNDLFRVALIAIKTAFSTPMVMGTISTLVDGNISNIGSRLWKHIHRFCCLLRKLLR